MLSKRLLGIIFLALVLIVGTIFYLKSQIPKAPDSPGQNRAAKESTAPLKTIGWIPYWDQKNAFESFSKNAQLFDFVSVFWYRIDSNGNLTTYRETVEDQSIVDFAHQNNVKILAVVANAPDYYEDADWDYQRVNLAISTASTRQKHISDLVQLVEAKNLDGIDIDYEALKASQKENFSLFIEELATKLHEKGKILGVAIHPKTSEDNPNEDNGSHAQDWQRIAKSADQLYFMTYTEHAISSSPGPAGSIGWIDEIMDYAIFNVKIPEEKIFLGIGLFGLGWQKASDGSFSGVSDDLTFGQIQSIIQQNNSQVIWDNQSKSSHFEYKKGGKTHTIWFENSESVSARMKTAKKLGVGGVAFWRLGDEDPKVWNIIKQLK